MPGDVLPSIYRRNRLSDEDSSTCTPASYATGTLPRPSSVSFHDPPTSSTLALPPKTRPLHFLRQAPPSKGQTPTHPKATFSSHAAPSRPALKSAKAKDEEERRTFYSSMPREVFPAVCDSPSLRDRSSSQEDVPQQHQQQPPVTINQTAFPHTGLPAATEVVSRDKQVSSSHLLSASSRSGSRSGSSSGVVTADCPPSQGFNTTAVQEQVACGSVGQERGRPPRTSSSSSSICGQGSMKLNPDCDSGLRAPVTSPLRGRPPRKSKEITGLVATPFRAAGGYNNNNTGQLPPKAAAAAALAVQKPEANSRQAAAKTGAAASRLVASASASRVLHAGAGMETNTTAAAGVAAVPENGAPVSDVEMALEAAASAAMEAQRGRSRGHNVHRVESNKQPQPWQLHCQEHSGTEQLQLQRDTSTTHQQDQYAKVQQQQQHWQIQQEAVGPMYGLSQQQQDQRYQQEQLYQEEQQYQQQRLWQEPQQHTGRGRHHAEGNQQQRQLAALATATALHEREVPYWHTMVPAERQYGPGHYGWAHQGHGSFFNSSGSHQHAAHHKRNSISTSLSSPAGYEDALESPPETDSPPPLPELRVHVPHSCVKAASDGTRTPGGHVPAPNKYPQHQKKGVLGVSRCETGSSRGSSGSSLLVPPGNSKPLPGLGQQLSAKALLMGLVVGVGYAVLMQRLALVSGWVPGFQVAITFTCWLLLRVFTDVLGRDISCIGPLLSQEVAVAAAVAYACANSINVGGFGSVLLALQPVTAAAAGLLPLQHGATLLANFWRQLVWMCWMSFAGALLAVAFRKQLMKRRMMTFPTGTAAGALLSVLHTPDMSYHGRKQMTRFAQWSIISFLFSSYQWVFNSPACHGFTHFPTFGLQALRYTWNFNFQLPFVGVGIMAPVKVAWSMLVGAVVCWGLAWPLVWGKEGVWYESGLKEWDPHGKYTYQLMVAGGLLLAEGLYQLISGLVSCFWNICNGQAGDEEVYDQSSEHTGSYGGGWGRKVGCEEEDNMIREASPDGSVLIGHPRHTSPSMHGGGWGSTTGGGANGSYGTGTRGQPEQQQRYLQQQHPLKQQQRQHGREACFEVKTTSHSRSSPVKRGMRKRKASRHPWHQEVLRDIETDAFSDASALQFGLAGMEAAMRRCLFLADKTPTWVGLVGYVTVLGLAVAVLPPLLPSSGVLFYHVLAAGGVTAVLAVGNMVTAGMTDLSLTDTCMKLLVLSMAMWGTDKAASGAVIGLLCGGWALGVLASANSMMYAYTAGSITMANPTAVMLGYMFGAWAGCFIGPFTLWLYTSAPAVSMAPGVGSPGQGLMPMENGLPGHGAPLVLALAEAGQMGFKLLPLNSVWVGLGAVGAGIVLHALAAVLPKKLRALIPEPVAIAAVAVLGAQTAVGVVLGCVVKLVWRWRYPRSADAYAWVVGAALLAGEGIWALGRGVLQAFQVKPPICMSFSLEG